MESIRQKNWNAVGDGVFDVAIIGAGVNGAFAFDRLCRAGFRVLLVDSGDFASGTSQASGMLVWGGLLYLRQLDFRTVLKLSRARDDMIETPDLPVQAQSFRYIASGRPWARRYAQMGLWLYWLLGRGRRARPVREQEFAEAPWLEGSTHDSVRYEEASLDVSDSRFVLGRILAHGVTSRGDSLGSIALNHCRAATGEYDRGRKAWKLECQDQITGAKSIARARSIINCAGVWTDEVNASFGINSEYRHALSKGVFVAIARPKTHRVPLIFDTGSDGDAICLIPWGPVSLWGPTETWIDTPAQGRAVEANDLRFLYDQSARHFRRAIRPEDVVSVRCGVRPLLVRPDEKRSAYPLDQSRRAAVVKDDELPWISVYGGKITGCVQVAEDVLNSVGRLGVQPSIASSNSVPFSRAIAELESFPGLIDPVISADWCAQHEACVTLEDYLRRRTEIAQWVPRCGLGRHGENRDDLLLIAETFAGLCGRAASDLVDEYESTVVARFDALTAQKKGLHGVR